LQGGSRSRPAGVVGLKLCKFISSKLPATGGVGPTIVVKYGEGKAAERNQTL